MKNNFLLSHTLFEGSGEDWTDVLAYQALGKEDKYKFPTKIILDYVEFVDCIQVEYADQKLPIHGGLPKKKLEINLDSDEYIQSVICEYCKFGISKYMICTLLFRTNKKESGFRSFYQPADKVKVEYTIPQGFALACIAGRTDYYNPDWSPCIAGLKLYFAPIKDNLHAFGILNPDFSYLKIKERNALSEDSNYCLELPTTRKIQLACAYIKVTEGTVAFTVSGKNGTSITSGGDGQSQISTDNNQTIFILNNPIEENWLLKINAKKGSRFKVEALAIDLNMAASDLQRHSIQLTSISDEIITDKNLLQPMTNALGELAIRQLSQFDVESNRQPLFIGNAAAVAHILHTCAAFSPWILVGGIAICGCAYIIYKLKQNAQESASPHKMKSEIEKDIREKSEQEYEKEGFWNWAPTSTDIYHDIKGWVKEYPQGFYCDKRTKALYEAMYQHFGGIEISKIPSDKYIDIKFFDNYAKHTKYTPFLHLDIGGEGCYINDGIRYGFETAIVLSGRRTNFYLKENIPMLLHVSDWTKDAFPFKDGTVNRITIQGITSPLTKKEADEIIRCINKTIGLIEIWTDNMNDAIKNKNEVAIKLIAISSYIANKLHCKLKMDEANKVNNSVFPRFYINLKNPL